MQITLKAALIFSPLLFFLGGVNYLVDPANIFSFEKYEKKISGILLRGLNAAGVLDYDERVTQKFYIQGLKDKKDVILMGSSRALQINSTLFPDKSFFNNCVSGSAIEDFISIFEIYQEHNMSPKVVIFNLDPWLLNKFNGQKRWESLASFYWKAASKLGLKQLKRPWETEAVFKMQKYLQLFSLTYFQNSIKKLFKSGFKKPLPYPSTFQCLEVYVKHNDGSICYDKKYRLRDDSLVFGDAKKYTRINPVYSLGRFNSIDKEKKEKFEVFLTYLLKYDLKVVFLLVPYHPYVYNYLTKNKDYRVILAVESYFKKIAAQKGIILLGSYDPQKCSVDAKDFLDGMHLRLEPETRLIKNSEFYRLINN